MHSQAHRASRGMAAHWVKHARGGAHWVKHARAKASVISQAMKVTRACAVHLQPIQELSVCSPSRDTTQTHSLRLCSLSAHAGSLPVLTHCLCSLTARAHSLPVLTHCPCSLTSP